MTPEKRRALAALFRSSHYVDLVFRIDGKTVTIQADDLKALFLRPEHPMDWTPAEVLYAFAGMLTTLVPDQVIGATSNATVMADHVHEFMKRHQLDNPRPGWQNLIVPKNTREEGS